MSPGETRAVSLASPRLGGSIRLRILFVWVTRIVRNIRVKSLGLTSRAGYSQFPILVYAEILTMYAIIDDGGRQHKVTTGDLIKIDREETDIKTITFDRVLLVGGEGEPKIGFPLVAGATVTGDVTVVKGKKIDTIKYRRRKGYHKKIGHRQTQLHVKISAINV
jgi:large subunit ribosomal protein L21